MNENTSRADKRLIISVKLTKFRGRLIKFVLAGYF